MDSLRGNGLSFPAGLKHRSASQDGKSYSGKEPRSMDQRPREVFFDLLQNMDGAFDNG